MVTVFDKTLHGPWNWPKPIFLFQSQSDEDGKCILIFSIEGLQNFTLYCPINYPEYNCVEDNFFVEADQGLQLWCNALNEYLLDTAGKWYNYKPWEAKTKGYQLGRGGRALAPLLYLKLC